MALTMPNGSTIAVASGYGSAKTVTALSNASPAVATSAAHGLATGDYVEVTSGWSRLNSKIVRVTVVDTDSFSLDGIDTTSTTVYPAGSGDGSVRKVTGFTQITQILGSSTSGGDQQFWEGQFLESDNQIRIPTVKSAAGLAFQIGDDPTLPGYVIAKAANDDRNVRALLVTLANSSKLLYNGYVSLSAIPSLDVNSPMQTQMTYSMTSEPTRYAS